MDCVLVSTTVMPIVRGSPDYLQWIQNETKADADG